MNYQNIVLSEERNVTLVTYLLSDSRELQPGIKRPFIVVCPGGGYCFLSDREAELIALQYNAAGFHAAVLSYGINEYAIMPGPFCDLAKAVAYIKEHAEEWFVDENQVFVSGFSAGGHVAAGLSVFWNCPDIIPGYENNRELIRPAGCILGYPVLDLFCTSKHLDIGIPHGAIPEEVEFAQKHPKMPLDKIFVMDKKEDRYMIDFEAAMNAYMFDGEYTKEQEAQYSLPRHISKDTPPAFLWHGGNDGLIFPENSLLYARGLQEKGISYELHIFGTGDHGLALANHLTSNQPAELVNDCSGWISLAIAWINRQSQFKKKVEGYFPA